MEQPSTLKININDLEASLASIEKILQWRDYKGAQKILSGFLEKYPQEPRIIFLSARTAFALGQNDYALKQAKLALHYEPENPNTHYFLSVIYDNSAQPELFLQHLLKTLSFNPSHTSACYNYANTLSEQGLFNEALSYYERALTVDSKHINARYNLGMLQLRLGNFSQGWDNYAYRFKVNFPAEENLSEKMQQWVESIDIPFWKGETLQGKSLLVWSEQGIGDEIRFAQCLQDLAKDNINCTCFCYPRMLQLYKNAFPSLTFLPNVQAQRSKIDISEFNFHCSIGTLAQFLRRNITDFPKQQSYLTADKIHSKVLRKKYSTVAGNKIVGISWKGGGSAKGEKTRKISLLDWLPILETPDITFVNLQYGDSSSEIKEVLQQTNCEILIDASIDPLQDMNAFAAQVEACDLVISIDNSTVHMAGALGKPTWLILSTLPNWSWMHERRDSPWYNSAKLFRQKNIEKDFSLLSRLRKELIKRANSNFDFII